MRCLSSSGMCVAAAIAMAACKSHENAPADPTAHSAVAAPSEGGRIRVAPASAVGEVAPAVRVEMQRAASERRRLVVYVGAEWCEPCAKFLRAARNGELDSAFGDVTLLEFDSDRDGPRLAAAGYTSRYIPLFALPAADGTSSRTQIEGGIKGDGAVANIASRLKQLLAH